MSTNATEFLVIKHELGNEGQVVDMTEEDISFCNFLLQR